MSELALFMETEKRAGQRTGDSPVSQLQLALCWRCVRRGCRRFKRLALSLCYCVLNKVTEQVGLPFRVPLLFVFGRTLFFLRPTISYTQCAHAARILRHVGRTPPPPAGRGPKSSIMMPLKSTMMTGTSSPSNWHVPPWRHSNSRLLSDSSGHLWTISG